MAEGLLGRTAGRLMLPPLKFCGLWHLTVLSRFCLRLAHATLPDLLRYTTLHEDLERQLYGVFTLGQALAAFPKLLRYTDLHVDFGPLLEDLKHMNRASAQAAKANTPGPRFKRRRAQEKAPW